MSIMADPEPTHVLLYKAHWAMVDASNKLHKAIVALHDAGRYADARAKLAEPIAALERARDLVDSGATAAGDGRTKLIHVTGCDGTCAEN